MCNEALGSSNLYQTPQNNCKKMSRGRIIDFYFVMKLHMQFYRSSRLPVFPFSLCHRGKLSYFTRAYCKSDKFSQSARRMEMEKPSGKYIKCNENHMTGDIGAILAGRAPNEKSDPVWRWWDCPVHLGRLTSFSKHCILLFPPQEKVTPGELRSHAIISLELYL